MCCIRGNQERFKASEPGPLWIFLLDYTLMSFSKAASKVAFRPHTLQLWTWRVPQPTVVIACLVGLGSYPIGFVLCVAALVSYCIRSHLLVWNPELKKWTDPRCSSVKVTYAPNLSFLEERGMAISKLPVVGGIYGKIFSCHIRSCFPVLDSEGDSLDFSSIHSASDKKKEASQFQGSGEVLEDVVAKDLKKRIKDLEAKLVAQEGQSNQDVAKREKRNQ